MELFYRKLGKGPPLIIVHGLYGSSDNWYSIGKALSNQFEVYIIDQRNHGKSPHSELHNYEAMKNDLKDFMDTHNINKATLIGHSMGGKTIMFFAAEFHDRVNHLIVVDIAPGPYKLDSSFQVKEHVDIMDAMLHINFSAVKNRSDVDKQMEKHIPSARIRQFLLKNLKRTKDDLFYWELNIMVLREELYRIMDGLDIEKFANGNGITGFPVLFIKGEKSNYISEKDETDIKQIFPFSEITIIPEAGHWVHAEQTALFLKTVSDFVLG